MKKLTIIGLLLICLVVIAQVITHPGYAPKVNTYGNAFNRLVADSAMHIPQHPCICAMDADTTPQLFIFADSLRGFWNGNYYNFGHSGGTGGGSFTADEVSLHLTGSVFSIKNTWTGQTTINTVGTITTGIWNGTQIADGFIASAPTWNAKLGSTLNSAQIFVGNGSNIATGVSMSGDGSLNNSGVFSLASVITGGNCTSCNITYDAKGRITVAANGTPGSAPFPDNGAIIKNNADNTRLLILSAAAIATATTRTWTFPNTNGIVARNDGAQTFLGTQTFASAPNLTGASTTGYVWTALDNAGNGGWAVGGSGGGLNQLTGDGTAGPGTGSQAFTLATVNGTVGTFGDGVHIPRITVNAKGLITNVVSNYIDSTIFLTVYAFNNSSATFNVRTPGTGANAIVTAFVNAGALVIPKWQPGYSIAPFFVAADSLIRISIDTSCISCAASKDYVNARMGGGGGGGTPGGATFDLQWNNAGAFNGGQFTIDPTNAIMGISKTQNNEIGYSAINFSTGAAGGVTYTASNGSITTKFGQYGSGNSFGMIPASSGFINSNAVHFGVFNYNNAGAIEFGVGASITLPTVRLTLTQLQIVPSILATGTTGDSLLMYRASNNAVYALGVNQLPGSGTVLTRQNITSGGTATVSGSNYIVTYNNSSPLTNTLTMPASPVDLQEVEVEFVNQPVTFTIVANSGQAMNEASPSSGYTYVTGEHLKWRWNSAVSKWNKE